MVVPTEKSPLCSSKGTELLKPHLPSSSNDGSEAPQNHSAPSPPDLKTVSYSVSFNGWRFPIPSFKTWVRKMAALHEPIWRKAGIFEAVMASTYIIYKNTALVLGVAEKWCPDTKTFVFPWGEATITLEDVMMLLGFSVLGSPVFETLDSSGEKIMEKLKKEWVNLKPGRVRYVSQVSWMKRFMDSDDELEHVAFLVLWLSYFVFPARFYHIDKAILPIAVHLSIGTKIAFAPAVLSHLYAELSLLKNHITAFNESPSKIDLTALFKLVLVWIWERFREIQPKPNPMLKGEPRLVRWSDLKQRMNGVREILDNSKIDTFEWRPYTKNLKNWDFPKFYPEEAIWVSIDLNPDDDFISFGRCIKVSELVGIETVQHYFPNRVALQFGMLQDDLCPPVNLNNLSKEAAWSDYIKPIDDDLILYIPSRLAIPSLAQDLPSFDHYDEDDIDVSPEVLPLTQELQELAKGFPVKRRRSEIRRSLNRDKVCELERSLLSSGWKRNKTSEDLTNKRSSVDKSVHVKKTGREDEADGSMAVAQRTRSRKKYSDAEKNVGNGIETLGKRTRRYVAADSDDDDDSGPFQKLASVKIEPMSEEDDETARKAQKTRRVFVGFEFDLNENAAEKETMIDDEPCNASIMESIGRDEAKKAECLLHEDEEKKKLNEWFDSELKKVKEIDERLKQRKLAIKEMEQKLEAHLVKMEKTLEKVKMMKTRRNQNKNGVSAA
ncbi:putative serinePthreonine-protein phosphatase 7 long form [Cardamine amara subsp. amara]|uniref:SerinePthreonine-protein phosphatase 7 long form n=1 Tax=Cardamine amara subsp. amara TaxID=228776 RepID=A0ABD1B7N0_CARAN